MQKSPSLPLEPFRHIRRLQIRAQRHVNNLFAGHYRSAFKGRGMEFEEVREYVPGDDIRAIDWNVTARSQHPFVKHFREERELTVILIVDISASLKFGSVRQLKSELVAEISALIAFSAIKNGDKVGLLLYSDSIELYLRPKKGLRHVLRVIRELLYFTPKGRGTNLSAALAFLGRVEKKRAICFLFSDFFEVDFQKEARIVVKKHELVAFHVLDPQELHFSPRALVELMDPESDERILVDTTRAAKVRQFEETAKQQKESVRRLFAKLGAAYIAMQTQESSEEVLKRFFRLRIKR